MWVARMLKCSLSRQSIAFGYVAHLQYSSVKGSGWQSPEYALYSHAEILGNLCVLSFKQLKMPWEGWTQY